MKKGSKNLKGCKSKKVRKESMEVKSREREKYKLEVITENKDDGWRKIMMAFRDNYADVNKRRWPTSAFCFGQNLIPAAIRRHAEQMTNDSIGK